MIGREPGAGNEFFAGQWVQGIGQADTEALAYDTIRTYLYDNDYSFSEWAYNMRLAAQARFGVVDSRTQRVNRAFAAVGLWDGGFVDSSLNSDARLEFANFTVSGSPRTYVFVRQPGGTNTLMQARYRTCSVWGGGCSWSAPYNLGYAGSGAGAATHTGQLWVFYRYDLNGTIRMVTLSGSGTWSTPPTIAPSTSTTDHPVAAVAFGGDLLVFWRNQGSGARSIQYARRRSTGVWDSVAFSPGGATSEGGPAVAVLGSLLYLVYVRDDYVRYRTLNTSGVWSAEQTPGQQSGLAFGTPDAHVYRNRLHVAVPVDDGGTIMPAYMSYCPSGCFYRPGEWTALVPEHLLWAPTSSSDVSLFSDSGNPLDGRGEQLYLFRNTSLGPLYEFKASE